jgi:selenocysteine lyase/cysteine desulfurase
MDKRAFLRTLGAASLGTLFPPARLEGLAALPPARLAAEEDFWAALRARYRLPADYVHLEHGYYSLQAQPVLDAFVGHVRAVNDESSRYMRTRQADDKRRVRDRLARAGRRRARGADRHAEHHRGARHRDRRPRLAPGDEAVMAAQDYGAMLDMFRLQARRHGVVNRVVSLPADPRGDDEIVRLYADAITPRTRLLMICHMVNVTGQILPVRAVADMARAAASRSWSTARTPFGPARLPRPRPGRRLLRRVAAQVARRAARAPACSTCGATAWPGSGRCSATRRTRPTTSASCNHTGTHPVHTDLAIDAALDFHEGSGARARRRACASSSATGPSRCAALPRVALYTPRRPAPAAARSPRWAWTAWRRRARGGAVRAVRHLHRGHRRRRRAGVRVTPAACSRPPGSSTRWCGR